MNYRLNLCESRIYVEVSIQLADINKWQFTLTIWRDAIKSREAMDPIFMTSKQALDAALVYLRFHAHGFPARARAAVEAWSKQRLVTFS